MIIEGRHVNPETNKPIDSFDLEQEIFRAWHVVDDLKLIRDELEGMDSDDTFSAIHGLALITEMRFRKLMDIYESVTKNEWVEKNGQREQATSFGQEKI
jgi:hypothetical protein